MDKNHHNCKLGVTMNSTSIESGQRTFKKALGTEATRVTIAVAAKAVKGNFQKISLPWEISLLGLDSCNQRLDSDLPGDRQIINLSWQPWHISG